MLTSRKLLWIFLAVLALILGACTLQSKTPSSVNNPAATLTSAAETVSAQLDQGQGGINATSTAIAATVIAQIQLTQEAAGTQVLPPLATATLPAVPPTNTPVPPTPIPPTSTSVPPTAVPPTATQPQVPCDRATFVEDVNYPDGTDVAPGTTFVKTWRLKNNGTCTWNSSYAVVFVGGDSMGGPAAQQLTTGTVAPGQMLDISVTLKAPETQKSYTGNWKLRNGSGVIFGLGEDASKMFFVKIDVIQAVTPTPEADVVFDLLAEAQNADWSNATVELPFGDPDNDNPGVAAYAKNVTLENDKTYSKALATYPQRIDDGLITGLFPSYTVKNNDHFRTQLGLRDGCGDGSVQYRFGYKEGANVVVIHKWTKSCDGTLLTIDLDLSDLAGKTVQFILEVSTHGSFKNDRSIWVSPRIER
jgi:hypothetical protein